MTQDEVFIKKEKDPARFNNNCKHRVTRLKKLQGEGGKTSQGPEM